MIQRAIYNALKLGFEGLAAEPEALEDIFGERGYGLAATEIEAIKTVLDSDPVNITHGYARSDQKFPLVAIILASDDDDEHWLGDVAGQIDDEEDPDFGADLLSSTWKHVFDLLIYAEHPDVTLYVYEIVKSIILTSEPQFADAGVFFRHLSGRDLAPDPRYVPEHLFVRKLALSCKSEFMRVDRDSKLGKVFRVDGIFIDTDRGSSEVGDVETNLVPYYPDLEADDDEA